MKMMKCRYRVRPPAPLPGYRGGAIGRGEDSEFSIGIDALFYQTDSRYIWQID
jgi:hypothetical protein